jgi:hypothetical protein
VPPQDVLSSPSIRCWGPRAFTCCDELLARHSLRGGSTPSCACVVEQANSASNTNEAQRRDGAKRHAMECVMESELRKKVSARTRQIRFKAFGNDNFLQANQAGALAVRSRTKKGWRIGMASSPLAQRVAAISATALTGP